MVTAAALTLRHGWPRISPRGSFCWQVPNSAADELSHLKLTTGLVPVVQMPPSRWQYWPKLQSTSPDEEVHSEHQPVYLLGPTMQLRKRLESPLADLPTRSPDVGWAPAGCVQSTYVLHSPSSLNSTTLAAMVKPTVRAASMFWQLASEISMTMGTRRLFEGPRAPPTDDVRRMPLTLSYVLDSAPPFCEYMMLRVAPLPAGRPCKRADGNTRGQVPGEHSRKGREHAP